jgi:hypothetical protein
MLLIYPDEKAWTESERAQCFAESTVLTHELDKQGHEGRVFHTRALHRSSGWVLRPQDRSLRDPRPAR